MKSYVRNTINLSCAKILLTSVIGDGVGWGWGEGGKEEKAKYVKCGLCSDRKLSYATHFLCVRLEVLRGLEVSTCSGSSCRGNLEHDSTVS